MGIGRRMGSGKGRFKLGLVMSKAKYTSVLHVQYAKFRHSSVTVQPLGNVQLYG